MVEKKVIPFQRDAASGTLSASEARQLGDSCRKLALAHLKELMQEMFDTADDTLFKLAESSSDDSGQGLYFDSMRIIRFKRDAIEEAFFNQISDAFSDFWISTPHEESGEFAFHDELSLVDEQDLEEDLAIKNLIRKIRSQYQQEISAIEKRLSRIVTNKSINEENNPIGAETICRAFQFAAQEFNADIKIKLILFKLFDFNINSHIGSLYQKVNETFIEAGVLPELKLSIKKRNTRSATSPQPTAETATAPLQENIAPTATAEQGYLSALQHLLHQPQTGVSFSQTTPSAASHSSNTQSGASLASTILASELTPLQTHDRTIEDRQTVAEISQQIKQSITASHPAQQISPIDSDIIDLVSMLFEFVLDDQHIPAPARSAIARLQIPIIKAAILDKEFFNINGHPARQLLNTLAHAALDLPADATLDSHPILETIQHAVDRILHEFNSELSVFDNVLQELNDRLEATRQENEQLAQESLQPFYQKEQHLLAEQWVIETIHGQIGDKDLPAAFTSLLLGPWKNVMIDTYLEEGPQSNRWKNQQRFIDILCWSIEPKFISQDRKKLGNIMRFLIGTLKEGLSQIDTPQTSIDSITQALEPYHHASLHGKSLDEGAEYVDGVFATETSPDPLSASIEQLQSALDELPDIDTFDLEIEYGNKAVMENIVLEGFDPGDDIVDGPDDEYLELARHLESGKWVEFTDDKQHKTRARLAWKSDLLGEFTFLNWKFDVIADKKIYELANDFRQGKAKVIDELPLIDRAFSAIMNTLQGRSAKI